MVGVEELASSLPDDPIAAPGGVDYRELVAAIEVAAGALVPDNVTGSADDPLTWSELASACNRHVLRRVPRINKATRRLQ